MIPTPKSGYDSSCMGHIVGYNNDSGMLYKTQMGMNQFKPKKNVVAPSVSYSNYSNKSNTDRTIEEMNADGNVDLYRGKRETIKVPVEEQPKPFSLKGKPQEDYSNKGGIKKIYE